MFYQITFNDIYFPKSTLQLKDRRSRSFFNYLHASFNGHINPNSLPKEHSAVWKTRTGVEQFLESLCEKIKKCVMINGEFFNQAYHGYKWECYELPVALRGVVDPKNWKIIESETDPTYISPIQHIPNTHREYSQIMNTHLYSGTSTTDKWCVKCKHGIPEGLFYIHIDVKSANRAAICPFCLATMGEEAKTSIDRYPDQNVIGEILTNRVLRKL